MEVYPNPRSGIAGFVIESDAITVWFRDGAGYRYSVASAGDIHVRRMSHLARAGQGLNGYINRYAKALYERRLR